MDKRTRNQIRNYLEANTALTPEQINLLDANEYRTDDLKNVLASHGLDDFQIEQHANVVEQKKQKTVVGPSPLPGLPPIVTPPRPNPPPNVVQLPTDVPEVERRDRSRWVTIGATVAALVILGLVLMYARCDGADKMGASINSGDGDVLDFDPRDPNDLEALRKDVDALKNDHVSKADLSEVDKKVDGAIESTAKLSGAVDQLANQVRDVAEKVNEIDCLLDEKAEKKDVDKVRRRVKRVERKINVHINNEVTVVDPYPDQPEPAKPPGTVTVIVRKVPVDD